MKRVITGLSLCLCLLTSCMWDEDAVILLSPEPIDPDNFTFINKFPVFKQRQRIYYILASKEAIESETLRLQVLKIDRKEPYFKIGYAYCIDINRGDNRHYVTDYFTLHREGTYFIRIFSTDEPEFPIAQTEFVVESL